MHVVTSTVENWYLIYKPETTRLPKQLFVTYISPIHYNSIGHCRPDGSPFPATQQDSEARPLPARPCL